MQLAPLRVRLCGALIIITKTIIITNTTIVIVTMAAMIVAMGIIMRRPNSKTSYPHGQIFARQGDTPETQPAEAGRKGETGRENRSGGFSKNRKNLESCNALKLEYGQAPY